MQDDVLDTVNLKPKARAERMSKSKTARKRRGLLKTIRETRMLNEFAKLRRLRKNR